MFREYSRSIFRHTCAMAPLVPVVSRRPPLARCHEEAGDRDGPAHLTEEERRTVELFERCSPSVVHITTQLDVPTNWFEIARIDAGSGSGFIWDKEGHIVTNFHVIRSASRANVTLFDHTVLEAELVGVEPDVDVAVLKVDFKKGANGNVAPVVVGKSSRLRVGQKVFAIGNPFGLDQSLSEGVVSGVGRQIEGVGGRVIKNVIQTDAAINPGNSGGPLLDGNGRFIGINTMIASSSGAWSGIGFAVPSATVTRTVNQIIKFGRTIRPWLGLSLAPMTISQRGRKQQMEGVLVISVQVGSPAELGGIRGTLRDPYTGSISMGDEIIELDGQRITDPEQVSDAVENRSVGDTIELKIKRAGEYKMLRVTLKDRPSSYGGAIGGETNPFKRRSRL